MDLMTVFQIALFASILAFLFRNYRQLNRSINDPIYRLKTMASRIAQGDLSIRVEKPEISELDELTDSLNTMVVKLGELIEQNIQKQQNLQKAEMKALQAQIAPHFMYNTLDTILSLAEDGQNAECGHHDIGAVQFLPPLTEQGPGLGLGGGGEIPRGELPRHTENAVRRHTGVRDRYRGGYPPGIHAQDPAAAPGRKCDLPRDQGDPPLRADQAEGRIAGRIASSSR